MYIGKKTYNNLKDARHEAKQMVRVLKKVERELKKMEPAMNVELGKIQGRDEQERFVDSVLNNRLGIDYEICKATNVRIKDGVLTVSVGFCL